MNMDIIRGHANTIRGQLTATNADTGVVTPLAVAQMDTITKIALVFNDDQKITTGDTGVALGAGKEFDHTVDKNNAILVVMLGAVPALGTMTGTHQKPHFDVWFSDVANGELPVLFEIAGEIRVL